MKEAELVQSLKTLTMKINEAWDVLDIEKKKTRQTVLEKEMNKEGFWDNQEKAATISQEASQLDKEISEWEAIKKEVKDVLGLAKEDQKDKTVNLREEVERKYKELHDQFTSLEFQLLFRGDYDHRPAIIAIHAGTGGVDAQDWAQMLLRMLLRYCEKKNLTTRIMTEQKGSEAGIKTAVFEVTGAHAYGLLKSEHGVHRLVRISPFDAEGMRHTSFALVEVVPEIETDDEIEVIEKDLKIDVFRASGHGGQSVNTTDSAVRITHIPTGITVSCQNERSQQQNKQQALKYLKAKLSLLQQEKEEEKRVELRGEYSEGSWGNQIRSYVLHPYQLVKDHRTNYEEKETQKVLDGELDGYVEAYLKWNK